MFLIFLILHFFKKILKTLKIFLKIIIKHILQNVYDIFNIWKIKIFKY